jgi:hypothetical protein
MDRHIYLVCQFKKIENKTIHEIHSLHLQDPIDAVKQKYPNMIIGTAGGIWYVGTFMPGIKWSSINFDKEWPANKLHFLIENQYLMAYMKKFLSTQSGQLSNFHIEKQDQYWSMVTCNNDNQLITIQRLDLSTINVQYNNLTL